MTYAVMYWVFSNVARLKTGTWVWLWAPVPAMLVQCLSSSECSIKTCYRNEWNLMAGLHKAPALLLCCRLSTCTEAQGERWSECFGGRWSLNVGISLLGLLITMAGERGAVGWPNKAGSVCLPSNICRYLLSHRPHGLGKLQFLGTCQRRCFVI